MGIQMPEVFVEGDVTDIQLQNDARSWIVDSLTKYTKGDYGDYHKLLTDLKSVKFDDSQSVLGLVIKLKALSQSVSFINEQDHGALLTHIFRMSLWMCEQNVADALVGLIVNLATSNGLLVSQCLDMLVRNFLPPSCCLPTFMDIYTAGSLMRGLSIEAVKQQKEEHVAKKDSVLGWVHSAIQHIAELVPSTSLLLQSVILQRMPHKIVAKEWSALYLESMLRLDKSAIGKLIGRRILLAVVDRLIEIDVEIRWEDIPQLEDSNKIFLFHIDLEDFEHEKELPETEAEAQCQHVLQTNTTEKQFPSLGEVADKMDLMMDLTLEHVQGCVYEGRAQQVYDTLLISFQNTILDTYKCKFTQFLLFYICALTPSTCGTNFTFFLCDIISSNLRSQDSRISAAAYLASYLARARYLQASVVFSSLKRMVSWCVSYDSIRDENRSNFTPSSRVHGVFYSVCQAIMYILCFRMRELIEDSETKLAFRSLNLQQLLEHKLSPHKVCLASVVEEFLKQAHMFQLMDVNALAFDRENSEASTFGGDNKLDMFFPFDPYLLKKSYRFIRPYYTFWSMVQVPEDTALDSEGCFEDSQEQNLDSGSSSDACSSPVRSSMDNGTNAFIRKDIGFENAMEGVWSDDPNESLGNAEEPRSFEMREDGLSLLQMPIDKMSVAPLHQLLKMPARFSKEHLSLPPFVSKH